MSSTASKQSSLPAENIAEVIDMCAKVAAGVAEPEAECGLRRRDRPKMMIAVYDYGPGRSNALCSCGWAGPRRCLKALAAQDAWTHCAHEKCALSVPLVIPVMFRSKEKAQQ